MTQNPLTLSSKKQFAGRVFRVRVDEVRLPSGRETVREVVEHPGAVVILPVTVEQEIIFVQQYRYAIGQPLIELPAGLIDPGETPLETARRELREEVGLASDSWREIATCFPSAGYSNEQVTIFLATDCRSVEHQDLDEGLDIVRWSREELIAAVQRDPFPFQNAATSIAVLWYVNRMG